MIVVDASAVCAILLAEPERPLFLETLSRLRGQTFITPVNHWEVVVRGRKWRGEDGMATAQLLLTRLRLQLVPTDAAQTASAIDAARRFGRGTRADLNMGDCFAYALAVSLNAPLLYKGDDFPHTDVRPAVELST